MDFVEFIAFLGIFVLSFSDSRTGACVTRVRIYSLIMVIAAILHGWFLRSSSPFTLSASAENVVELWKSEDLEKRPFSFRNMSGFPERGGFPEAVPRLQSDWRFACKLKLRYANVIF